MDPSIKLLVVDDHPVFLNGYNDIFSSVPEVSIVGKALNGKEVLKLLERGLNPDIILLDISMPVMDGLQVMEIVKRDYPRIKVILVSFNTGQSYISKCISLGANAYITKGSDGALIIHTVFNVHYHGVYYSAEISAALENSFRVKKEKTTALTPRETEVLILLCNSFVHKQIAAKLNVSIRTVDTHVANIYKKTGAKAVPCLVFYALENNLISRAKN